MSDALGVDPTVGLTSAEAARRLAEHGHNEIDRATSVPSWRKLLRQFDDPLIYLLLVAVVISAAAWLVEGASGLPVDAVVIALIVIANAVLGYAQEVRAEGAVEALKNMTEVSCSVLRGGEVARIVARDVVPGDVLVLGEGDSVGADARVLATAALQVAESVLTGESLAVLKQAGPVPGGSALADRTNMVYKGTAVTQGTGRAVVTATGMATEMGAIATMLASTGKEPTPLQKEIGLVGRLLTRAVVAIAVVVMGTIWVVDGVHTVADAVTVLLLGLSLAVAAVPEGLPAILSVVLSIGVRRMTRRHAIVKELSSVETLGSASVICSDKTGTLTSNEMTLQRVMTYSGTVAITGLGYRPDGQVLVDGGEVTDPDLLTEVVVMLSGGALASNAEVSLVDDVWRILGDPTEAAILVAELKLGASERRKRRFSRIGEVPFTSERKFVSTVQLDHEHEDRPVLVCKGAPDVLVEKCTRVKAGLRELPMDSELKARILADVDAMASDALRTLSVAYRTLASDEIFGSPGSEARPPVVSTEDAARLEHDLVFVGTVGIIDPPRSEALAAVHEAQRAGIRVLMITGDHPSTALRIARDLEIAGPGEVALTGPDLDALDSDALRQELTRTSVYARVAPEHKLRIVRALQADGKIVAMTGDGANDAPALKAADIGVAMGISGTEVSREAAAMILADDNFATIIAAVRHGRVIFDNIKKFLRYLLSSNMGEVLTVFGGVVLAGVLGLKDASADSVVLPLLATQILWVNLVTDSVPALAMGVDPETDDVMARPPRPVNERVIDTRMWGGVILIGAVIAVVSLLTIDIFLPGGLVSGHDSWEMARTAGFTTLVLTQLFNALNSRSETASAFRGMFVNPWLWAAVGFGALAQVLVVEVPVLQRAFSTAPLDLRHWLVCAAMASSVLWVDELRKVWLRRSPR